MLSECSSLAESYTEPLPPLEKVDLDTLSEITRDGESSNMQPPRAKRRCVAMREEMQKLHKLLGNHGTKEETRKRIPSRRSSVRQSQETAGNRRKRSTSSQTKGNFNTNPSTYLQYIHTYVCTRVLAVEVEPPPPAVQTNVK